MRHPNPIMNAIGPVIEAVFLGALWLALSPVHVANFVLRLRGKDTA